MDLKISGKFKIPEEEWCWMRHSLLKYRKIHYTITRTGVNTVTIHWVNGVTHKGTITTNVDYNKIIIGSDICIIEKEIIYNLITTITDSIIERYAI